MKIYVNAIGQEGIDAEEEIDPSGFNVETEYIHYPVGIKVKAHAEKGEDVVTVNCNIRTLKRQVCSRCLREFEAPVDKKEEFIYKLEGERSIDLNGNIRDSLILGYPIRILCNEDCKGLCFSCGKNLNEGPCNCKRS